jgi:hypothetical protein
LHQAKALAVFHHLIAQLLASAGFLNIVLLALEVASVPRTIFASASVVIVEEALEPALSAFVVAPAVVVPSALTPPLAPFVPTSAETPAPTVVFVSADIATLDVTATKAVAASII